MLAVYLAAFGFGAVLVGASTFFGGHDHDAGDPSDAGGLGGHDAVHLAEHDVGSAATATLFNPLLSLRFWSFFLMAFGATGAALSALGVNPMLHVPAAVITGGGSGWLVSWTLARLRRDVVSGDTRLDRLRGSEVEVLLAIGPGKVGKIRATLSETTIELPATCVEGRIERGEKVLIVEITEGKAVVTPLSPRPHPERQTQ